MSDKLRKIIREELEAVMNEAIEVSPQDQAFLDRLVTKKGFKENSKWVWDANYPNMSITLYYDGGQWDVMIQEPFNKEMISGEGTSLEQAFSSANKKYEDHVRETLVRAKTIKLNLDILKRM